VKLKDDYGRRFFKGLAKKYANNGLSIYSDVYGQADNNKNLIFLSKLWQN
jgi:hypothetical protein